MIGRVAGVLVFVLALAVLPSGAAEECFRQKVGNIEQEFGDCAPDNGSSGDGPWLEITLWTVSTLGAGGAAFFGWNRVRRRRSELRVFLTDVETAYAAAKADPVNGLPQLEGLRSGLQKSHDAGKLDDPQFLQLDRKLAEYVARARILQLERAFPNLPMAMFQHIRDVVSDGHLSAGDLEVLEKRAVDLQVPQRTRQDLNAHLRAWAGQSVAPAVKPRRMAVVSKPA